MNISYTKIDSQNDYVIIEDSLGKIKIYNNTDNVKDILECENRIEILQEKIMELKEKLLDSKFAKTFAIPVLIFIEIFSVALFSNLNSSFITMMSTLTFIPLTPIILFIRKVANKTIQELEFKIPLLEDKLQEEEIELEMLKTMAQSKKSGKLEIDKGLKKEIVSLTTAEEIMDEINSTIDKTYIEEKGISLVRKRKK